MKFAGQVIVTEASPQKRTRKNVVDSSNDNSGNSGSSGSGGTSDHGSVISNSVIGGGSSAISLTMVSDS
jgi:hypothetical protein